VCNLRDFKYTKTNEKAVRRWGAHLRVEVSKIGVAKEERKLLSEFLFFAAAGSEKNKLLPFTGFFSVFA